MNAKKIARDMLYAVFAQGLSTAVSVILTLLLPKVLGVAEFGYWQLFIFYLSYVGFFHFGINDGVYLIHGGETRDVLDKKAINSQFLVSIIYQAVISVVVILVALFGPFEAQRQFVIVWIGIILLANNCSFYLGYVFQAVNETALFSFSTALDALAFFAALIILVVFGADSFEPYIIFYTLAKYFRLVYCLYKARDILSAGVLTHSACVKESIESIRVGIKLMFANIVSSLILGVVRFFVDLNWGIEVFSIVSFSLSIAAFFLTFLTQVSMVLFPNLKQLDRHGCSSAFSMMRDILDLVLPAVYIFYGPITVVLNWWLPQYARSIQLFAVLFPICVFEGKMDIVGTTFFKVLREEKRLLEVNLATLLFSFVCTLFGTYALNSVEFVLFCVVIALAFRCLLSELLIGKTLNVSQTKLSFVSAILSVGFVITAQLFTPLLTSVIFLFVYSAYLAINKTVLRRVFKLNDVLKS